MKMFMNNLKNNTLSILEIIYLYILFIFVELQITMKASKKK